MWRRFRSERFGDGCRPAAPECPLVIGGLPACNDECPWPCDPGSTCREGVCAPDELGQCANLPGMDSQPTFCNGSSLCATTEPPVDALRGWCVPQQYCSEVVEAEVESRCWYADFSPFGSGPPPAEECPSPPHPTSPFCGGPCGECPPITDATYDVFEVACMARSEERDIGLCVMDRDNVCDERDPLGSVGVPPGAPPAQVGVRDVACAIYLDRPVLQEHGFLTRRVTCLAYREMFPDVIDCMDHNWESFP